MRTVDPSKIERFRDKLREEWTDEQTVAAWRKWNGRMSEFTREATAAILEAAQLRSGMQVLDLASGVGDPALVDRGSSWAIRTRLRRPILAPA